jgi:predicted protein tyrosine phosphatase
MPNIRTIDMQFLDDLFDMGGGYVLDFSDRTMATFFAEELNVDIDDAAYRANGNSKARRLRCFLQTVDMPTVVRTLKALWECREATRMRGRQAEQVEKAEDRLLALISRLEGKPVAGKPATGGSPSKPPVEAFNRERLVKLRSDLLSLHQLQPHPRGYAFEKLLGDLFNLHGLEAREPFRIRGEQIDGSFQLANETYLLEAKWHGRKIGAADLHAFHGKLAEKAAWTRGLFVSESGFTEEGLHAFGRGKRVICMDGLDLYDTMSRELPLDRVIERKARAAAETGSPFVSVRDLFAT